MRFIPLASSSLGCAYLVTAEGHAPLLIDCGLAFSDLQKRLWSHGVNVSDLAGVIVSHSHADHSKAVFKLMYAGVDVWASQEAWDNMHLGFSSSHRRHIAKPGRPFYMPPLSDKPESSWRVQAFCAVHDSEGTLGFLVDAMDEGILLYLSDSAYCPNTFAGLTHICVEANFDSDIIKQNVMAGRTNVEIAKRTIQTHSSIDRVIDMLKANDLSKCQEIFLLHLSRANSNAKEFKEAVQMATGVPTYICAENGGVEL